MTIKSVSELMVLGLGTMADLYLDSLTGETAEDVKDRVEMRALFVALTGLVETHGLAQVMSVLHETVPVALEIGHRHSPGLGSPLADRQAHAKVMANLHNLASPLARAEGVSR